MCGGGACSAPTQSSPSLVHFAPDQIRNSFEDCVIRSPRGDMLSQILAVSIRGAGRTVLVPSSLGYFEMGSVLGRGVATLSPTSPPTPPPTPLPTPAPTLSERSIQAASGENTLTLPQWSKQPPKKISHRGVQQGSNAKDPCSKYLSCEACINNDALRCGFCGGSKTCTSGSDLGPATWSKHFTDWKWTSKCEDNWSWTDCANVARDDDSPQAGSNSSSSSMSSDQKAQLACGEQLNRWHCSGQSLDKCIKCAAKLEGVPACALLGPAFIREECSARVPTMAPQKAPTRALVWHQCSRELRALSCLGKLTPSCVKCANQYQSEAHSHPPTVAPTHGPTNIPFRRRLLRGKVVLSCFQNRSNAINSRSASWQMKKIGTSRGRGSSHFLVERICVANAPLSTAPTVAPTVAPTPVGTAFPTPCALHLPHTSSTSATNAVVSACLRSVRGWCGAYR